MPGIAGLITRLPRPLAEEQLARMLGTMRHESFYTSGTCIDEGLGVYVGWVAHNDSFSAGMPLRSTRGDVALIFSGEEYPDEATRAKLAARGSEAGHGAGYLIQLAEESGADFVAGLNGRFHGVLIDNRRAVATLFNDRYGMGRIYYHEDRDSFYFAAEAKAILSVRPELRQADAQSLGELVSCGCVLENRTLFRNVHVLPPASAWSFESGVLTNRGRYFDERQWEQAEALPPETYYQELRDTFAGRLGRYVNGGRPIGMSLTGGLDSRMIMAWWKSDPASIPCYSFGGMFRDCQDVIVARDVAQACGQQHATIPVGKEFLSRFARYSERTVYLTDGCADVSRSADLYINEQAREIAPVRMTGNYGGEVLRRVRAFKPMPVKSELFRPELADELLRARFTYGRVTACHPLSFAVFRQAPWHHYGLLALEQTQLTLRSPYLDNDLVRLVFRAPVVATTSDDVCLRLIHDGAPALGRMRTDRGIGRNNATIGNSLTRELLEFSFKAEYAYDYGMPQWLARIDHRLARLHLERAFLGRHKFYHFRVWYRDALAPYLREMLLDRRTLSRPYLDGKVVERMVEGHLRGDRNYTLEMHKLLTLEHVHRLFLDGA